MAVGRGIGGGLMLGGVDLGALARDARFGTPAYVYDLGGIARGGGELAAAFDGARHVIAYAIKANSAGPVVRTLRDAGCGADVVSGAELALALACGVRPDSIVFSGVAKLDRELDAAVAAGILAIQVESVEEVRRVAARARALGRAASVSLRVNPEASLHALATHSHIATGHDDAKFGVPRSDLPDALDAVASEPLLELVGLSSHVGSQLTTTGAYLDAARTLFEIVADVRASRGERLRFVDTGGGFGVDYGDGCAASPSDFVREARVLQRASGLGDLALVIEPGRALVAPHGLVLASVVQVKVTPQGPPSDARRRWLLVDAGMNDLLRPALYQARHRVVPVDAVTDGPLDWRVVGPVCESSDDFGVHSLPATPPAVVAILDAGAYGYTMASRYNGRALAAEVFVADGAVVTARPREAESAWVNDRATLGAP